MEKEEEKKKGEKKAFNFLLNSSLATRLLSECSFVPGPPTKSLLSLSLFWFKSASEVVPEAAGAPEH